MRRRHRIALEAGLADALRAEAAAEGGQLGGLALVALVERAEAGYARLSEALPHGVSASAREVPTKGHGLLFASMASCLDN